MEKPRINLIWFKRDLRVRDHAPLYEARKTDLPALGIYCYEPSVIHYPDFSGRHLTFINQSLSELGTALKSLHVQLRIFHGEVLDLLKELQSQYDIQAVYAHQETGNQATFHRDLGVINYLKCMGIDFFEFKQFGVIRKLKSRDTWSEKARKILEGEPLPIPEPFKPLSVSESVNLRDATVLKLEIDGPSLHRSGWYQRQVGGERMGLNTLSSFLAFRGENYSQKLSSPVSAYPHCSRISPYLTYGNISLKTVFAALRKRQLEVSLSPELTFFKRSLSAFEQRLYWHCHFIQKLEDEPNMEFKALSPALDELRLDSNLEYLEAWKAGETGFHLVDACMKALTETGWLNFRMRAMLCSFATYHLWLDWRLVAHHLAKLFIDYEPGIHYSQIQMQSGITGINAVRIYNPLKQQQDQDPALKFCHYWLSSEDLKRAPLIDLNLAAATAKAKIFEARKTPEAKKTAQQVFLKHGSRQRPLGRQGLKKSPKSKLSREGVQLDLFGDGTAGSVDPERRRPKV